MIVGQIGIGFLVSIMQAIKKENLVPYFVSVTMKHQKKIFP